MKPLLQPPAQPAETEISRAIRESREAMGVSQDEVARLIPIKRQLLEEFEAGITTPTVAMLGRLSQAIGGEDLAARFPYTKPTDPVERAKPENMVLRLQHLINVVAQGHQTLFTTQAGIGPSTFSKIMKGERGLSPEIRNHLTTFLPNLNMGWLLSGEGEPFWGDSAPIINPRIAVVPTITVEQAATEQAVPEQPTMVAIPVLASATVAEIQYIYDNEEQSFPSLGPVVDFLEYIVEQNCGLTPQQVKALLEHF